MFYSRGREVISQIISHNLVVGRLGGSDFDAVCFHNQRDLLGKAAFTLESRIFPWAHLGRASSLNGFFYSRDASLKKRKVEYYDYLDVIYESWKSPDIQTIAAPLLSNDWWSFRKSIRGNFASKIAGEWIPFPFIEHLDNLAQGMSDWPRGTRVLVVSPFSESIAFQKKRLDQLIPGISLAHLDISTISSPITYSTGGELDRGNFVPGDTWIEVLNHLKEAISLSEFDVCLASCGSYAGPVIQHVKTMGKAALYLGSLLLPLFNLNAARFNTRYYRQFSNPETLISPLEAEKLREIASGFSLSGETLKAYLPSTVSGSKD